MALSASPVVAEISNPERRALSLQGGVMTSEDWIGVLGSPATIDYRASQAFSIGASVEWSLGGLGYLGVELTVLKHRGEQDHWELSGPIYLRTHPWPSQTAGLNLAYGLGLRSASCRGGPHRGV